MKNLVILGSHPRTRSDVDFNDPNLEIWAFNEVLVHEGFCKRADAIFQMHPKSVWNNPQNPGDKDNAAWLKGEKGKTPKIWMLEKYPEVPMSEKYPFDEIREKLLKNFIVDSEMGRKDFYGSSVAYSTALGIYLGYKKIDWYGVELEQEGEYKFQVPSAMFWAGIAIGMGIEFTAHTHLFDKPLYGIESFVTIDKQCFLDRMNDLTPRIEAAREEWEKAKADTNAAFDRFKETQSAKDDFEKAAMAQSEKGQAFGYLDGAKQENERYYHLAEAMENASGSYVFSRHQFERDGNAVMMEREKKILDWSAAGGMCQSLTEQIEPKYDGHRRRMMVELRKAVDEYLRLSVVVGLLSGGAREDYEIRERIPM
jgi:hypothetical protein